MGAANGKQKEDFAQAAAMTREVVADMVRARNNDIESGAGQGAPSISQTINETPVHPGGETTSLRRNRLIGTEQPRWPNRNYPSSQLITTVTTVPSPLQTSPLQTTPPLQTPSASIESATQTEWIVEPEELTYFDAEAARAMFLYNAIQVQASALVLYFFWNDSNSSDIRALKYWAAAYTGYIALYTVVAGLTFWNRKRLAKNHSMLQAQLQILVEVLSSSNIVWFVVGNILVYGPGRSCPSSPIYTMSVIFLAIKYFQLSFVVVPTALIVVFVVLYLVFSCLCLPCRCLCSDGRSRRTERVNAETLKQVRKWFRPPPTDSWMPWRLYTLFPHPVCVGVLYFMFLCMALGVCFCPARTRWTSMLTALRRERKQGERPRLLPYSAFDQYSILTTAITKLCQSFQSSTFYISHVYICLVDLYFVLFVQQCERRLFQHVNTY